jgi:multiple sugar transport system substrate-binding protein
MTRMTRPNGVLRGITMALATFLVASACTAPASSTPSASAQGSGQPSSPATTDNRRVELRFANWFYAGPMQEAYDTYIAAFLKTEPRVTAIKVETTPFVRYHDVMNVQLAGGKQPNIAWINASVGPQYVGSGKLLDLTPYVAAVPNFDLADFGDQALAPWKDGSKLTALPFTNAGNVVFYNKDVFAKAGLPTPIELQAQGKWTWDTLKESARVITAKGAAQYGYFSNNNIFTNGFRNLVEPWSAYGAAPWSADGKTCTFNSSQAVQATQLYWDMLFVDKSMPLPDAQADFAAGNIGMAMGRSNQIGPALTSVKFGWDVTALPSGPAGFVPSRAQNGLAVFADVPNADLAAKFVVFTLTKENAALFSKNSPSARQSLDTVDVIASVTNYLTKEQIQRAIVPALTSPKFVFEYYHPNFAAVERNANVDFSGLIWVAKGNVKTGLDQVCKDVQALMAP